MRTSIPLATAGWPRRYPGFSELVKQRSVADAESASRSSTIPSMGLERFQDDFLLKISGGLSAYVFQVYDAISRNLKGCLICISVRYRLMDYLFVPRNNVTLHHIFYFPNVSRPAVFLKTFDRLAGQSIEAGRSNFRRYLSTK